METALKAEEEDSGCEGSRARRVEDDNEEEEELWNLDAEVGGAGGRREK